MKIKFGTSIIEALSGNLVLRKSKSFLITRRSLGNYPDIPAFHSSKKGSKVRAARRREISDLGFSSDLRQCGELVSLRRFGRTRSRVVTKRVRLVSSLLVFRNLGWGFSTDGV